MSGIDWEEYTERVLQCVEQVPPGRATTYGSLLHSGMPPPWRSTNTTLLPLPMSVAVTESACTRRAATLRLIIPQRLPVLTSASNGPVWTRPP